MPSLRALLLTLFLIALALLTVVVFIKESKPVQDAQSYAEQNPNCSEIKIHSKNNDLVECFLNFNSLAEIRNQRMDSLYMPMLKFIGERYPYEFPLRVRYVFSFPDKTIDSLGISGNTINVFKNSVWQNRETGCIFPGPCPVSPFQYSERSGEKGAVNAIMPGIVIGIERVETQEGDSYSITIYHGGNIYSKTSGLSGYDFECCEGTTEVSPDEVLGFLRPQDSVSVSVEINGKHKSWETFYKENRPQ